MRIVVDAMGSDDHPTPDISGAVMAARELGDTIILVGNEKVINRYLVQQTTTGLHLEVVHADEIIHMTDKPSAVGKGKPSSSIHVGLNLVRNGDASAFVTMGNTGAVLAVATLHTLRRIPGIKRPALSQVIRITDSHIMILDIGANADSKPEWLTQFAVMGRVYMQNVLHTGNPRVALLSNGEEEGKGNQLIHEASALLQQMELNYVGNIEPKDVFKGQADVIVTDGFVGNIAVKTFEASARFLGGLIRDELNSDILSILGGLLSRPALGRVYRKVDPFEVGGALLLGINGVVIIGHGRSNAVAVKNAIRQAHHAVIGQVVESIKQGLAETLNQK